jgi:hypothetical protein
MDNAANNDTFISELQASLSLRDDHFDEDINDLFSGSMQRIRYVIYLYYIGLTNFFK